MPSDDATRQKNMWPLGDRRREGGYYLCVHTERRRETNDAGPKPHFLACQVGEASTGSIEWIRRLAKRTRSQLQNKSGAVVYWRNGR